MLVRGRKDLLRNKFKIARSQGVGNTLSMAGSVAEENEHEDRRADMTGP